MDKIVSILPNDVSFDVAFLHQILAVLDLEIAPKEVAKRRAGPDTQEKVRALQAQLGVPVDERRLVDPATALGLQRLLNERGLIDSARSFTVSGQVWQADGTPGRRQRLLAFDLDLRAVGAYRTIKTIAELDKNGGFEFLGETVADSGGRYSVTFYDWQYRRAERKKADVVVFAVADTKRGLQITGQSRLVTTQEYADSGRVEAVDVILPISDARVEYERVMATLTPFLEESGVRLAEIAESAEQIVFAANELDLELAYVSIAAAAQIIAAGRDDPQLHEALYGIGRQNIELTWSSLYRKREDELLTAIESSVKARIINPINREDASKLVRVIRNQAGEQLIPADPLHPDPDDDSILPERAQRLAFLNAIATFRGTDFREFWDQHLREQPEFKEKPELVSKLLFAQQLSVVTAGYEPLVKQLTRREGASAESLLEIDRDEWLRILTKTGVPDFVEGATAEVRMQTYADMVQGALNAAFPTRRLAILAKNNALFIESGRVARGVTTFLNATAKFDVAASRVDDFDQDIAAVAREHAAEVKTELKKLQRVFQVSPSPEAMTTLLESKLHSASAIAEIPRKVFLHTYGSALGGEETAYAVHQRAEHIARRAELVFMHMREYVQPSTPAAVMGTKELSESQVALKKKLPNYSEFFGSPDLCECEHCRSVVSPAAYFVELLRFLWRGKKNSEGKSPLDMLDTRRPDLKYLPLTCENTNTIIPYIDLATEVMEYYTAHDSLVGFQGYDTGEATTEELRANPQNVVLKAHKTLRDAKYPFTLPFHQPLHVIRTYSDHLGVSRAEAIRAANPTPGVTTARATAAESLRISEEEYKVLTGEAFDGSAQTVPIYKYFGYDVLADLEKMSGVREFLARSGASYLDLVELIKTRFINPHQWTLDFIGKLIVSSPIGAPAMYAKFKQIKAGTLNPAGDADITTMLTAHNAAHNASITAADLGTWLGAHFDELREVITLYQPNSSCDLDTTSLRTLASIYEAGLSYGITDVHVWSRIHRFIRLQRRLGWSIHETDLVLAALGQTDITHESIEWLDAVLALKEATKLSLDQLSVLWGVIDSYGEKSLYRKLFLNKSVQRLDDAFKPNAWGEYLTDSNAVLVGHRSAIQAAFRISEEDLDAIAGIARVIDNGVPRAVDLDTDILNLSNLSAIYRHVALSSALKVRPTELATLIELIGVSPFSTWDTQQGMFVAIEPIATRDFFELAASTRKAGFKTPVLEYVLTGTVAPTSTLGLDRTKALHVAKTIRQAFIAIEQAHTDAPPSPLTPELLTAKLALGYSHDVVSRFMAIVQGTATFDTLTDKNIALTIPEAQVGKYLYVKGSGRLTSIGVVTDDDKAALSGLVGAPATFGAAVQELYVAPEQFIAAQFSGVFSDLAQANATLLDHPKQVTAATQEERLAFIYRQFVPILKRKLRADAITQHIASLIGLDDVTTAVLIATAIDQWVSDLSKEGFSADYFSDSTWTTAVRTRVDPTIEFEWGLAAPDPVVPADNFSVRWRAYIAPPASGEYTAVVDVIEADEAFKLYLDEQLVLEKASGAAATSLEVPLSLNAAQMHALRLDYAEMTQKAGIRLQWRRATTGLEVVRAAVAYPSAILDAFVDQVRLWHRAAKFITTFKLTGQEVKHFITFAADFAGIAFTALTLDHWKRVRDYTSLRDAVPQAQATLIAVFAAAKAVNPAPTVAALRDLLHNATAWNKNDLEYLVNTHFALTVADFRNEIALNRVRAVMAIINKSGLAASTVAAWGGIETDFDKLHAAAQLMKNAVKAKYDDKNWLDVAGGLSDKIREHQKAALIGHLLTRPAILEWGATDADGLFEYFLIDVQMCACMDTSRVVQASAAVQMFVNRCLLNLESKKTTSGSETGVPPNAIDQERWEWMKNYRVWQANREVFLYPENWLAPEWRMDRSELFKDLESYLVQNDINDRSVEQAFRNYLASLAEIGNLEMCGLHQEYHDDRRPKLLHVFGRTRHAPYSIYYRTWDEYQKWSAWQKVPVSVRVVENGEHSGVHLIPVVWKKRLFLFWPEFNPQQEKGSANGTQNMEDMAKDKKNTLSSMEAKASWDIKLAWSERVEGKWTSKQVSGVSLKEHVNQATPTESSVRWVYRIDSQQKLHIIRQVRYCLVFVERGRFTLPDITATITAIPSNHVYEDGWVGYEFSFQDYVRNNGRLRVGGDDYLRTPTYHKLLATPTRRDYTPQLDVPFFFHDRSRTYFVRPVDISAYDWTKKPIFYAPRIPPVVEDLGIWKAKVPKKVDRDPIFTLEGKLIDQHESLPRVEMLVSSSMGNGLSVIGRMAVAVGVPAVDAQKWVEDEEDEPIVINEVLKTAISQVDRAFGGVSTITDLTSKLKLRVRMDKGLEFHTMHHPYSGAYVTRLNQLGMPGLMNSDTELTSDEGATFEGLYDPNVPSGLVQYPSDFPTRTYYKDNVCFDVYGANSLYNWELFFHAPLYIATRLSRNGQYREAMKWFHYIFDPTSDADEPGNARYWKVLPFKTEPKKSLEEWFRTLTPNSDPTTPENPIIKEWRDNPFDPHRVAANRPIAYMKHVVLAYVQNIVDWADMLFRQDSRESVNEALPLYVIANHILGRRPERVPKRGTIKAESYHSLEGKWDDFSNALVELENIFPYSSDATVSDSSAPPNLLGIGPQFYFCIPPNDRLLKHWDTVADRLYKIRHCQNIDGIERKLALFAPPIDPGALVSAMAQGLSLGSILADLSSPPPIYRFSFLIQKANEFCNDVKALGATLLAALEKKDAEALAALRVTHERSLLESMRAVKERQLLDARARREGVGKQRDAAVLRLSHYVDLLGAEPQMQTPPSIASDLTADSPLPPDSVIAAVEAGVDVSLVDSEESGVKLIPKEKEELDSLDTARDWQIAAQATDALAAAAHLFPVFSVDGKPFGVGAGVQYGGALIGNGLSAIARTFDFIGAFSAQSASLAAKMGAYIRREQDWAFQANMAAKDIIQLDKQITSADIQVQVAQKELDNHNLQVEQSQAVEQFLAGKFTSTELYQWQKEQLFDVYKRSYNLAYELAKKAEKAYKFEVGAELASFVQYGYWDDARQGLAAGERLQLALRHLENAYINDNRRELELSRSISLAELDPLALVELRERGKCRVSIPEELFDRDFRGHYYRRIKAMRLSIPCVAGPYTPVSCSLRLLNNSVRINTKMSLEDKYEHENDNGLWIDDERFRTVYTPVTAIATSSGQSDAGMFEFNFKDDRYLPFEGAGAISEWELELSTEKDFRQFDQSRIAGVILHMSYTAREDGGLFKEKAGDYLADFLKKDDDLNLPKEPLVQLFSLKDEFPSEWHRFLRPAVGDQILKVTLGQHRFPFLAQNRTVTVGEITVLARCSDAGAYTLAVSYTGEDDNITSSNEVISISTDNRFGELKGTTIRAPGAALDLDVTKEMTIRLKQSGAANFTSLTTQPDEVTDLYLAVAYRLV